MANTNPGGLDLNNSPYYDDFDEEKKFARVLFVPGRAVQARELTQAQTLSQKQVERFANYFFKPGSILDGCEQNLDYSMPYLKLQQNYDGDEVNVSNFLYGEITGANTGIKAYVGIVSDIEDNDPKTLFINYTSSGSYILSVNVASTLLTVGNTITFSTGNTAVIRSFYTDPITSNSYVHIGEVNGTPSVTTANTILSSGAQNTFNITLVTDKRTSLEFENSELVYTSNVYSRFYALSATTNATRYIEAEGTENEIIFTRGSKINVGDGIIYIADHFIKNSSQTLILDKYTNRPSYKIGLVPEKSFVDYLDDTSLLDNAAGTPNFQAPGADRLKIDVVLTKIPFGTSTDENEFVSLIEVEDGIVKKRKDISLESKLGQVVAKRTFEESGNYTLSDPKLNIREHLLLNNNGGRYEAVDGGNTNLLLIEVDPFTAYVSGFRTEFIVKQEVSLTKGLDTQYVEQVRTQINSGSYIEVNEVMGDWDIMEATEVDLYNTPQKIITRGANTNSTLLGTKIGTARVKGVDWVSGNPGTSSASFYLYLTDVTINSLNTFSQVRSIYDSATPKRFGDIVLDANGNAVLQEQSFGKLIFNLPYSAIKTLRDTQGELETGFRFRKVFNVNFSSGQAVISSTDTSETFVGTGALSSAQKDENYFVVITNGGANVQSSTIGTGSIHIGSNTILSVSVDPRTRFNIGDVIRIASENHAVKSLPNSSSIVLSTSHVAGATTQNITKIFPTGTFIDLSGNGGNGSTRGVTVSAPDSVTINIQESHASTFSAKIYATMDRSNAREMRKILNYQATANVNPSTHSTSLTGPYGLGHADVYRIHEIYQSNDTTFATAANTNTTFNTVVTSNYIFDNGQRDNSYEHATVTPKVGYKPTGRLLIVYDHFTHDTTQGIGYLSVDSYPINDVVSSNTTITTSNIPVYTSTKTGAIYDLRNCIDFRPIKTANTSLNPADTGVYQIASGGLHTPLAGSDFDADLIFYKGRVAKLYLNSKGELGFNNGSPGYPIQQTPPPLPDTMEIAELFVPPYPSKPIIVPVKLLKNKRYTMADIGKIESRVNKLEYYTALNLLERQASEKVVIDDTGIDRFKNGVLVDPFAGSAVADVSSSLYNASINRNERYATAYTLNTNQVKLNYNETSSTGLTKLPGRKLFLNYTTENFISQVYASNFINLAQELTWSWIGDMDVFPPSDTWLSTERNPAQDLVIDTSADADNWRALANAWNTEVAPQNTYWIGQPAVVTSQTTRENINLGSTQSGVSWQYAGGNWWNLVQTTTTTTGADVVTRQTTTNRSSEFINVADVRVGQATSQTVDRVIDVSVSHVMRSRDFIFYAAGIKPGASMSAFFDEENVTTHCKQIKLIGSTTIQELADLCNNNGFLPANALGVKYSIISNGSLTVNESNDIYGIFRVPANSFYIGTREFKLTDSPTNNPSSTTTYARTSIQSSGLTQTKSSITYNTRPSTISFGNKTATGKTRTDSVTTVETSRQRVSQTTTSSTVVVSQVYDPVAQSFYVDEITYPDGVFVTSIDLYFKKKSSNNNLKVSVEIREMENGLPTRKTIGGEIVRKPSSEITTSTTAQTATTFTFANPVFLLPGNEYCFVAKPEANSTDFEIWTAELGQLDITNANLNTRIDKNNALIGGVVFTSSNDSTWTPRQNIDVKFNMKIAVFSTTSSATAIFENVPINNNFTYSVIQSNIEDLVPSQTSINYEIRTATPTFTLDTYISIKNLERVRLTSQKQISNTANETAYSIKSLSIRATMSTRSRYISPYIDLTRGNAIFEDFEINNFTSNTDISGTVLYTSGSNIVTGVGTDFVNQISSGQYVKFGDEQYRIAGDVVNATHMVIVGTFSENNTASQTISIQNEENPEGPYISDTRYISRRVALNDGFEATDLVVFVDVNRPSGTDIKVYYKILNENDADSFDSKFYQEMDLVTTKTSNQNEFLYSEEKYVVPTEIKIGGSRLLNGDVLISTTNNIVQGFGTTFTEDLRLGDTVAVGTARVQRVVTNVVNNSYMTVESAFTTTANTQDIFKVLNNEVQYETPDGRIFEGFKYYAVKVVFLSNNKAYAPRIKNLRALALA
ncbi:DUF4815 domain-containing protein [bacterium]|nr:DUF4815 domain-containing protein [bacterium]